MSEPLRGTTDDPRQETPGAPPDEFREMAVADPGLRQNLHERLIGPYAIRRLVWQGGLTETYQALDMRFNEYVFLKETERSAHPSSRYHFLYNEAVALRHLNHTCIIKLLDYRDQEELLTPILVTEFIAWPRLDELLNSSLTNNRADFLWVVRDIASALAHCHLMGIAHLGIKPSVIFVDSTTEERRVKLTDFELSVPEGLPQNEDRHVIGTPYYMTPEQLRADKLTPKSDVYSLGLVLLDILGSVEWRRDLSFSKMLSLIQEGIPTEVLERTPRYLRPLVARMLSVAPEGRPSMQEVHAELTSAFAQRSSRQAKAPLPRDASAESAEVRDAVHLPPPRPPGISIAMVVGIASMVFADALGSEHSGGQAFVIGFAVTLLLFFVAAMIGERTGR